ncbi:hypothetical protein [Coxiella burnetii]|nr:hypothetical protein [Coxiella burnetii]ACJ20411.1 hypothetical membrane-associated protein [Coxiella burnetii CbuK_Q154]EDQ95130.1 hypothetical protein A35_06250 [Coxiella burnetii 'MSU Goat Q177']UYK69123.1 hypothetical protein OHM78_06965 [Coxiella burnetii]
MNSTDTLILEEKTRMSQSLLWDFQRQYYYKQGPQAFANQVPFYVTCNPFIANVYAELIFSFIRDWIKQHPQSVQSPFYVLELGAGSGRFSFYTIKRLCELLDEAGMKSIALKYVMSDFSRNSLDFWLNHPALTPYVQRGVLDFVLFDIEKDKDIPLRKDNSDPLTNPLVVIANYIFDTIMQDCFYVENKQLHESLLTVTTRKSNTQDGRVLDMEKVNVNYTNHRIGDNYYNNADIDGVLMSYKEIINKRPFTFPVFALQLLQKLMALSQNRIFLISADKSYCTVDELMTSNYPQFVFHGSFSMTVNMHAIALFFERLGGGAFFQSPRKGIKTSVCYSGFSLNEMPETRRALAEHIEGFSAADYFTMQFQIGEVCDRLSVQTLLSCVNLSRWDPHLFKKLYRAIHDKLKTADQTTADYLRLNI